MGSRSRRHSARSESFAATERLSDIEAASEPRVRRLPPTANPEAIGAFGAHVSGELIAGKYRLLAPLARGAMGAIWRARHSLLECDVALKLMDERVASSNDARQRFWREARTAARLRGSHVVQLLDYGVDGETPYLVMELLEGESLRARLARLGKLSKRQTLRIVTH
jgi:serine/threonine protein kinase